MLTGSELSGRRSWGRAADEEMRRDAQQSARGPGSVLRGGFEDGGDGFAVEVSESGGCGWTGKSGGEDFGEAGTGQDASDVEMGIELEVGVRFFEEGWTETLGEDELNGTVWQGEDTLDVGVMVGIGVWGEFGEEENAEFGTRRKRVDAKTGGNWSAALAPNRFGGEENQSCAMTVCGEKSVVYAAEKDFVLAVLVEISGVERKNPTGMPVFVDQFAVRGEDGDLVRPVPGMVAGDNDAAPVGARVGQEGNMLDGVSTGDDASIGKFQSRAAGGKGPAEAAVCGKAVEGRVLSGEISWPLTVEEMRIRGRAETDELSSELR